MGEVNHVVARFLDGRTLKGTTDDFLPTRAAFHVYEHGATTSQEVKCAQLKALFFVRDLAGDPSRKDAPGFPAGPVEANKGKKIVVQFKDREVLTGYTLAYTPDRNGFFVTPSDPNANNLRVFVFKHATLKIAVGAHADSFENPSKSNAA